MTEQHPVTDEMCREIADSMVDLPNGFPDAHDHIRAGADWQLEQVIKWIEDSPVWDIIEVYGVEELVEELKKAMRPQQ